MCWYVCYRCSLQELLPGFGSPFAVREVGKCEKGVPHQVDVNSDQTTHAQRVQIPVPDNVRSVTSCFFRICEFSMSYLSRKVLLARLWSVVVCDKQSIAPREFFKSWIELQRSYVCVINAFGHYRFRIRGTAPCINAVSHLRILVSSFSVKTISSIGSNPVFPDTQFTCLIILIVKTGKSLI